MRFELLRQRVERAERRVEQHLERARNERAAFGQAWKAGWTPGRIVVAGLVSGFLVGRGQPLSRVGGARWLQVLGTVSSMLASLRAAAASEDAGQAADQAARGAEAAAEAAADTGQAARTAPAPATAATAVAEGPAPVQAPAPAEAATDVSER